jgi:DNA replication protein DnaC
MPDGCSKGLYLWGSPGVGKTHIAAALAIREFELGSLVRFTTLVELQAKVRSTYGTRTSEDEVLDTIMCCRLLVLDDVGKERPTEWSQNMLYRIIDSRYNAMLPVIITSNYGRPELAARLATGTDDEMAACIVSRLSEMCESLHVTGIDRRLGC